MHDVAAVLWASCRVGSCQKNASRELWGFAYTTGIVRKMVLGDPRLTPKVLHPSWGSLEGLFKFPVTSWVPFEIPCVSFGRLLCPLGCPGDPFGCLGGPWGLLGADYMLAPSFCLACLCSSALNAASLCAGDALSFYYKIASYWAHSRRHRFKSVKNTSQPYWVSPPWNCIILVSRWPSWALLSARGSQGEGCLECPKFGVMLLA